MYVFVFHIIGMKQKFACERKPIFIIFTSIDIRWENHMMQTRITDKKWRMCKMSSNIKKVPKTKQKNARFRCFSRNRIDIRACVPFFILSLHLTLFMFQRRVLLFSLQQKTISLMFQWISTKIHFTAGGFQIRNYKFQFCRYKHICIQYNPLWKNWILSSPDVNAIATKYSICTSVIYVTIFKR